MTRLRRTVFTRVVHLRGDEEMNAEILKRGRLGIDV